MERTSQAFPAQMEFARTQLICDIKPDELRERIAALIQKRFTQFEANCTPIVLSNFGSDHSVTTSRYVFTQEASFNILDNNMLGKEKWYYRLAVVALAIGVCGVAFNFFPLISPPFLLYLTCAAIQLLIARSQSAEIDRLLERSIDNHIMKPYFLTSLFTSPGHRLNDPTPAGPPPQPKPVPAARAGCPSTNGYFNGQGYRLGDK